jgi:hypothetical protein
MANLKSLAPARTPNLAPGQVYENIRRQKIRVFNRSARFFASSAFLIAFIITCLLHFVGRENADWEAYENIFKTGGAWLFYQQRDPAFLGLISFFKSYICSDYNDFRFAVGSYFFIFTCWVAIRWRKSTRFDNYIFSYAGVLPLFFPKFTVQIREGLAQTLVFAAFTILIHREFRYLRMKALRPVAPLLIAAAYFHSSAVIFFAALLAPQIFISLTKPFGMKPKRTVAALVFLTLAALAIAFYTGILAAWAASTASDFYEGFRPTDTELSAEKIIYWIIKSCIVIYLILQVRRISAFLPRRSLFHDFIKYTTYALIPCLQLVIFFLIMAGNSANVASAVIRLYHSLFYMVLALFAFIIPKNRVLIPIIIFLLYDEYRVLSLNATFQ